MKTLDRSRNHGTIHPPHEGAHYTQDGYYFDAEGKLVEALLKPEQKAALAKKASVPRPAPVAPPKPAATPPNPNAQSPAGAEGVAPEGNAKEGEAGGEPDAVNLEQWLRDPASAYFKDVRLAVKERYSVWKTAKAQIVEFLVVEQKLLPPEEIDAELRQLLPKA